ncbi:GIY-YIG nuclease family protein [Cohnella silvisoli]|uniref:GIY-YIG nuclease family protein n=1 Tax=Cohnella silvisoli TaxID=2873699 RepID=A0ABV1KZ33_9BACL|nr:GIY-YIG nuclease family protein [Cohnella silvisoli]MCD9024328.1 GIY-YIG nuclease family protein [Cohnella silvisoli]
MILDISLKAREKVFNWVDFSKVRQELKRRPGVYVFYRANEEAIYVGMSKDLSMRLSQHAGGRGGKDLREAALCRVYLTSDSSTADILETHLINELMPELNIGKAVYSEFVRHAEDELMYTEIMIDEVTDILQELCESLYENLVRYGDDGEPDLGEELYLIREIRIQERRLRKLRLRSAVYRRRGGIASGDGTGDTTSKYNRFRRLYSEIERRFRRLGLWHE